VFSHSLEWTVFFISLFRFFFTLIFYFIFSESAVHCLSQFSFHSAAYYNALLYWDINNSKCSVSWIRYSKGWLHEKSIW